MNSGLAWRGLIGGLLATLVATGLSRFAYTAILPLMQDELGFGADTAGLIGSANFLGYLIGALAAMPARTPDMQRRLIGAGLIICFLTTAGMGEVTTTAHLCLMRFVGGIGGAWVFVLYPLWLMRTQAVTRRPELIGWAFAGTGIGIALSGGLVGLLGPALGNQGSWWLIGMITAVLSLLAWGLLPAPETAPTQSPIARLSFPLRPLALTYFLEGLSYIVFGTFIVAALKSSSSGAWLGDLTWILVGLAAAPATLVWARIASRIGSVQALIAAFTLQGIGIAVPALYPGAASAVIGALFFGGTFMATAMLTLSIGRASAAPEQAARNLGFLTAAFGLGQIVGPLAAGALAASTGSFYLPFLGAAAASLLAVPLLILGIWSSRGAAARASPADALRRGGAHGGS